VAFPSIEFGADHIATKLTANLSGFSRLKKYQWIDSKAFASGRIDQSFFIAFVEGRIDDTAFEGVGVYQASYSVAFVLNTSAGKEMTKINEVTRGMVDALKALDASTGESGAVTAKFSGCDYVQSMTSEFEFLDSEEFGLDAGLLNFPQVTLLFEGAY
jgi:hypothetical protein